MSSKKKQIYDIIYDFTFEQLEQEQIHLFSEKLQNLVDAAIPAELYKYRPPEEKHINSFESDDIYLNFPTAYNDPTDCVLFYSKSILLELQAIINSDEMDDEDRDSLQLIVESIRDANSAIDLAAYIPSSIKVACFSENIQSPLMWSHYADEHKGFALGYDFRNACIKECTQCLIGRSPTEHMRPIYPVVYKQKRTDMTAYLLNMIRAKNRDYLRMVFHIHIYHL